MYGQPGQFYFHYTTREAAFGHILPEGRLRMSPYFRMRDPLEAESWHVGAAYFEADDTSEGASTQAFFKTRDLLARIKRETKLLALTEDAPGYVGRAEPFGRGWGRARMWEQYAEDHRGVCLVFDRATRSPP